MVAAPPNESTRDLVHRPLGLASGICVLRRIDEAEKDSLTFRVIQRNLNCHTCISFRSLQAKPLTNVSRSFSAEMTSVAPITAWEYAAEFTIELRSGNEHLGL